MIYIVTDGDYSEYNICGVFTDLELAQEYAEQNDYDNIEHHEENPEVQKHPDGYQWQLQFDGKSDEHSLDRLPNEANREEGWWCANWSKRTIAHCTYFARDLDHANKIASDKVAALKAGSTFAYEVKYQPVTLPMSNGRIPARANHQDRHDITLRYDGTQFIEIHRETTREKRR